MTHFKLTQASLISLFTTIVGFVAAFVPNISSEKEVLISAGTTTIAAVFLLVNAIHAVLATKVNVHDLESGIRALAKDELGKLNVNGLVQDTLKGADLTGLVRGELNTILARAASGASPVAGVAGSTVQAAPAAEAPPATPAA